jgi:hypothetical protein
MGLQDEVRRLIASDNAKHKRLIDYVVRQIHGGRDLDVVLEDPYVTNRISPIERRALLEEPEVIAASREDVLQRMRAQLEALVGGQG